MNNFVAVFIKVLLNTKINQVFLKKILNWFEIYPVDEFVRKSPFLDHCCARQACINLRAKRAARVAHTNFFSLSVIFIRQVFISTDELKRESNILGYNNLLFPQMSPRL